MKREKKLYSAEGIFGRYMVKRIKSGTRENAKSRKRLQQLYSDIEDYIEQA